MKKKIEELFIAACSGDINTLKYHYDTSPADILNKRYIKNGNEHSLIMGAFRNNQFKTIDYLVSVGETITEEEKTKMVLELKRIEYMKKLVRSND